MTLWGCTFEAQEGGLDDRLINAPQSKNELLRVLVELGKTLVAFERKPSDGQFTKACSRFEKSSAHLPEMTAGIDFSNIDDLVSLDSERSMESGPTRDEELIEDVRLCVTCLYELCFVIQDPAESLRTAMAANKEPNKISLQPAENTAWPYINAILSLYRLIDRDLAERLGEANLERYQRLETQRSKTAVEPNLKSSMAQSAILPESTVISTQRSSHSSKPANVFSRSWSASTAATSISGISESDDHKLKRGRPKMPQDQPWGEPFNCTVCGNRITTFSHGWSHAGWV